MPAKPETTIAQDVASIAETLHGLIRAMNPVTLEDCAAELDRQSIVWDQYDAFDREDLLERAVNALIRSGRAYLTIDTDDGGSFTAALDLPHPPQMPGPPRKA